MAYASLVLDICIAVITVLTFFDIGNTQPLLIPINCLLTVVVALSVVMFVILFVFRVKEKEAVSQIEDGHASP